MIRIGLPLISFAAITVAGAAAYLWTNESGAKISAYEEMRKNIDQVENFSKLFNVELLKIHDGIILNYTTLNQYKPKIESIIEKIRKNPVLSSDQKLLFRFEYFATSRTMEISNVEAFKTVSSLYRNSEMNFAELSATILQDLATRPRLDGASADWLRRYVGISRDLRTWVAPPSKEGVEDAPQRRSVSNADEPTADGTDPMAQALAYGKQAVQLNDQIRAIIDDVFNQYYNDTYLSLLDHIDNRLGEFRSQATNRKIYLVTCVVLLCLMVLVAIALLVRALQHVREARSTLEDRVTERTRELTEKSEELERYKDQLEEQVDVRTNELNRKAQELVTALIKEQQYSKLQKDFVSMISHEFRTPVAIIDMAAQRILRKKPEKLELGAIEEFANGVRKNTRRLTGLIDRTLTSSKFREGQLEFKPAKLNLTKLLTDISAQHEKLGTGNAIHMLIDPDIPEITGDLPMLEQIFTNLIGNAVKYSPEKTPVVVRVRKEDDFIRVEVIDQGIGIPEKELSKLFQRYFRASNARVIAGTGLGLAIAKEMIELHGGRLQVTTSENKGSAFIAVLPISGPRTVEAEAAVEQSNVA
jgi:signal transduction histidine kinase